MQLLHRRLHFRSTPPTAEWYDCVSGCECAWKPKGSADLAASYSNLKNPGTNTATPGNAPRWDATNGWKFDRAQSHYLRLGFVPSSTCTVLIRLSNVDTSAGSWVMGSQGSGNSRFLLTPDHASFRLRRYAVADKLQVSSGQSTSGVLALVADGSNAYGYLDGSLDVTISSVTWASDPVELYIGCYNANGSPDAGYKTHYCQAVWGGSVAMSGADIATLSAAMAAL